MNFEDLRRQFANVSLDNIGDWPIVVKGLAVILVAVLVAGGGFYFLTQNALTELSKAEAQELTLRDEFSRKQEQASNLETYRAQLRTMEKTFAGLKLQLPDSSQVPDLLVEITQAGLGNGLEFDLFQPKKEKPAEFYAELPISIVVQGAYHDIAQFASDVAGFARIVTLHDVAIVPEDEGRLRMSATAKTYRYLDEEES